MHRQHPYKLAHVYCNLPLALLCPASAEGHLSLLPNIQQTRTETVAAAVRQQLFSVGYSSQAACKCRVSVSLAERLLARCRTLNYGEGIRDLTQGPNPIINRSITHNANPNRARASQARPGRIAAGLLAGSCRMDRQHCSCRQPCSWQTAFSSAQTTPFAVQAGFTPDQAGFPLPLSAVQRPD